MTLVMICLTAVMFLPIVLAFASVPYRSKQFGQTDISTPRAQAEKLEGAGHRTVAAQKNAWEALVMFVASLGIAFFAGVVPEALTVPVLMFVMARIFHGVFYVAGNAPLRVLSFIAGLVSIVWILVLAFRTI